MAARVRRQKRIAVLILWSLASCLAVAGVLAGLLTDIETRTWDWRLRFIANQEPHNPKIKLIVIDQTSLDHFSVNEKIYWPWPRSLYVPVLRFLERSGAKAAAFDMLFTESSGQFGDDAEFAAAVKSSLPVVSAVALRSSGVEIPADSGALFTRSLTRDVETRRALLGGFAPPRYGTATLPIPELIEASRSLGNVTSEPDEDKIFRRTTPGALINDLPIANLPFALFADTAPEAARDSRFAELQDPTGKLLVRFFGPAGTYDTYSIHAVINSWLQLEEGKTPAISLDEFKDAIVLIGGTAPGLLDLRSVPVGGAYSGVEINATILDNALRNGFLRHVSPLSAALMTVALLALAALLAMLHERVQLVGALVLLSAWFATCFYAATLGWWIPMVIPMLGMALMLSLGFFLQYQLEGKQHRFIRGAFQHFVTAEVVNKIIADPSLLALGGERKELTMLFSDIAGFTTLSEAMEPAELVRFINTFLSEMTDIILSHEGTIDKYEGDAIIAFWNAPLTIPDHEARSVRAALQCQERLRELADYFQQEFGVDVQMRVGINTGVVTVGNFGSSKRFNYTMIGDAANLASRLEGTNKVFGTRILVSESTKEGVKDGVVWRRVADVQVKGKKESTRLYEPLDPVYQRFIIEHQERYEAALRSFEAGDFAAAREAFGEFGDDPVSKTYLARIERIRRDAEGQFSPVWVLTEK